jgi:hypothetical protein
MSRVHGTLLGTLSSTYGPYRAVLAVGAWWGSDLAEVRAAPTRTMHDSVLRWGSVGEAQPLWQSRGQGFESPQLHGERNVRNPCYGWGSDVSGSDGSQVGRPISVVFLVVFLVERRLWATCRSVVLEGICELDPA